MLFLITLFILLLKLSESITDPFKPKFHTPNDYDINGLSCSLKLPSLVEKCPLFGVLSAGKSNLEIEASCKKYGFFCENPQERLFRDGSCHECPNNMIFVEKDGDAYCQDPFNPSSKAYNDLINPFDCQEGGLTIPRTNSGLYRPCYDESRNIQTTIEHFSTGKNLADLQTLEFCAADLPLPLPHTEVDNINYDDEYSFSIIGSLSDKIYPEIGYLQCSLGNDPPKNMTTPIWITVHSAYIAGFIFIVAFAFYKYAREKLLFRYAKRLNSINSTQLSDSNSSDPSYFQSEENSTQEGFISSRIGIIAQFIFKLMTAGLLIIMLVIQLDLYGMNYLTFCKDDPQVIEACREPVAQGLEPHWRTGYNCAHGCVFSGSSTLGNFEDWPFYQIPGGGARLSVAFLVIWHLLAIWLGLYKLFSSQINCFFHIRCPLHMATIVLYSRLEEKEIIIQSESTSVIRQISNFIQSWVERLVGKPAHKKMCPVHIVDSSHRYFDFQSFRYCWNESTGLFQIYAYSIQGTQQEILINHKNGLTDFVAESRATLSGKNSINIEIPPLYVAIIDEFSGYIYLYQFFAILVWVFAYYWTISLVTLVIILISAIIKISTKRSSQWKVKNMTEKPKDLIVQRNNQWKTIKSNLIVTGDVIKLNSNGSIPCDAVLLDGRCVVDESSLTGEPTPVPKISINQTSSQQFEITEQNMKYILHTGTQLQSFSPGITGDTLALVIATGAQTNKGQLMHNLLFPPPLSFTFDQHITALYMVLLLWGVGLLFIILYFLNFILNSWILGLYAMGQVFSPLIPAVYVAALSQGAYHLSRRNVFCLDFYRMAVAGKLKVFCFDKTGTLTKPGLEFRGVQYIHPATKTLKHMSENEIFPHYVKMLCGCCHELDFKVIEEGPSKYEVVGNEVDTELFNSCVYEVEELTGPTLKSGNSSVRVLRRFEFDRSTMSMSVIIQDENQKKYVFTKGSYESIANIVNPDSLSSDYKPTAEKLAKQGIYMLGIGYKEYDGPEDIQNVPRSDVERDLTCLGLLMFENPLKPDTKDVIDQLTQGNISSYILTGDNPLTASFVSRQAGISTSPNIWIGDLENHDRTSVIWRDFDSDQVIAHPLLNLDQLYSGEAELAITGRAFLQLVNLDPLISLSGDKTNVSANSNQFSQLLPFIRIYSRLTPDQKVTIISHRMQIGLTGMCGDGANDLGALRLAHCGVAVSAGSSEASIVAPFSSPEQSLEKVLDVIKEGRATLSKAMACFKALVMFGECKAFNAILQNYFGMVASEAYWVVWDSIIYLGTSWCLLQSKTSNKISQTRPTAKLFGLESIFSAGSMIFFNVLFLVIILLVLFSQEWFLCHEHDANNIDQLKWWLKGDNYEASLISTLITFQFLSVGPAFNLGYKYRSSWWKNYWMTGFIILCLAFFSYVYLSGPSFLSCVFRINCGDQSLFSHWSDIGILSENYPIPSNAPVGCSCESQIAIGNNICEEEYINCTADHFNSIFHHNYIQWNSRLVFYGIFLINFALNIFWEAFVVLGPVRSYLKRKKINKSQTSSTK